MIEVARQFADWYKGQTEYKTLGVLAVAIGVSRAAVKKWKLGENFPGIKHCEKLHAITQLDCFGCDQEKARAEHERLIPASVKKRRRADYLGNAEARRAASRESYRENHERQRQFVTPEELEVLRARPDLRKGVCRECGEILSDVGPHLGPVHKMKVAAYKKKWGFLRSRNATRSEETNARQSAAMKRSGHAPPKETHAFLSLALEASRLTNRKNSARLEERLNARGRKLGPRPEHWKRTAAGDVISDARVARERLLRGLTVEEIAERVELAPSSVLARLRRMGFPARARLFFHGGPVSGETFWSLCADFKLTKAEAVDRIGVSEDWAATRLTRKREAEPVSPELGKKILALYSELRKELRNKPSLGARGAGRPRYLTQSDEREILERYKFLLGDLRALRHWTREGDAKLSKADLWRRLCEQFRAGHFRSLQFCPQFFTWVEKAMEAADFLAGTWIPRDLAIQFLASDYSVSEDSVAHVLSHPPKPLHNVGAIASDTENA